MIKLLRERASLDRIRIASAASLKVMLSRWENGNATPRGLYRRLLCTIYQASPDDLGLGAVTLLQAARLDRGWTRSQVVRRLRQQAAANRVQVASASSMITMLSRWENGAGVPDLLYRRLLCTIYQLPQQEFGRHDQNPRDAR